MSVTPSKIPEAAVVLNQMLTAMLWVAVPLGSTRPVSAMLRQALCWAGLEHHAPSSGISELVPLKDVAVTPETGPATPRVVPNSVVGGSTVVRSSTGTWLAAAVALAASFSR